jgi:exodeoxyribonuclease VII small subunit
MPDDWLQTDDGSDQGDCPAAPTPEPVNFPEDWSYEDTVAYVEDIINQIEMGEMDLARVFEQFASAVRHLRQCETFLQQQKQHMGLLMETLRDDDSDF